MRCWNPPDLGHFFKNKSGQLAVCCFVDSTFNQLSAEFTNESGKSTKSYSTTNKK